MTRNRISALILSILLLTSLMSTCVNATSDPYETMEDAAAGKNILKFPVYIDGGDGFNDSEGSEYLLDYEDEDTKYGTNQLPYYVEWQYESSYVVERILLRTANDNLDYARRMGDGWTLSGSNDGKTWTVIYTGKEDDVLHENFTYFTVDLPDNTESYQYYQVYSENAASDQEDTAIQLSALVLCVNEATEVPTKAPYVYKPKILRINSENTVIEATDFDSKQYNETGTDGEYTVRPDEEVQTQFCGTDYVGREGVSGEDTGCVGWTAADEWVQYTINVTRAGVYQIDAWLASDNDPVGGVEVFIDDTSIGSATSNKDGWQNYSKITVNGGVEIESGSHVFKVLFPTGGVNFNALEFTKIGDLASAETEAPATEEEVAADTTEAADDNAAETTTESSNSTSSDSGAPIVPIIIGAVAVIAVIIIIVVVSKKKK